MRTYTLLLLEMKVRKPYYKKGIFNWAYMHVIPTLGRLRQENHMFQSNTVCILEESRVNYTLYSGGV